jgi:NAD(P)-dependent dehydrogenase (short-subunit alcohol dehydrogenase family)
LSISQEITGVEMAKVWLVTGCSKGFGRVLVEQLLATTSDCIVATARTLKSIEYFSRSYPDRVLTAQLDVTKEEEIQQTVDAALKRFQRIDVLVNNAGYGLAGALEECSMEEIRRVFETNVFGLMAVTKAVLPCMRQQKSGYILNISSVAGLVGGAGVSLYNSTKFALEGLSEGLAPELADFNIKLTLIEPGPFRTDFAGDSIHIAPLHPEYQNTAADQIRTYLKQMHSAQPGDPVKAANIMIDLANKEHPPLRLPLGNIAMDRIRVKFGKQAEEFARYEPLARSADH